MSIPIYNVPNAPGVPPMVRAVLSNVSTVQGISAGIQNTLQFFQGRSPLPPWGIYDSGFNSVVSADSFLSFSHRRTSAITDAPTQDGGFVSYNKVVVPDREVIRVSKGGTLADRQLFLAQIDALFESLDKFTIVTPEKSYINRNVEEYEITRRDKDGAFFLTDVDLFLRQIRPFSTTFTNTAAGADTQNAKNPDAPNPDSQGVQQAGTPSPAAQSQANNVLGGGAP